MRHSLSAFAVVLGMLCPVLAEASIPRVSSSHHHPSSRTVQLRQHTSSVRSSHADRWLAHRRDHRASLAGLRTLRHLRARGSRRLASLKPEEPSVRARLSAVPLDTVPLEGFHIPAALKGSHDSLIRQNVRAEADGLLRIEDDGALLALRQSKSLVALPVSEALRVDERLAANRRYCREWTAQFLGDLSRVHYGRFGRRLQVNSAVRTVAYQRTLGHRNGNAAPADGDIASPHLTGATIDIAKKGLSLQEIGWMRAFLLPLETAGKLDVEEEFHQACFHITVYKSYLPAGSEQTRPRGTSPALIAATVR